MIDCATVALALWLANPACSDDMRWVSSAYEPALAYRDGTPIYQVTEGGPWKSWLWDKGTGF